MQKLLDRKALRFSSGSDGAGERFEFLLTVVVPANGDRRYATHCLIARDKDSVAVVVLSAKVIRLPM